MGANHTQITHVDSLDAILFNERHASNSVKITGELGLNILQVPKIDLIDDLQMSWEHNTESIDRPSLKRLGQQSVIGVGARLDSDLPGLFPGETLLVDEDAHELRYGERRVRVVELDGHFLRQTRQVVSDRLATAEFRRLEATDDVLESRRAQEVLLFETQVFAFRDVVVRVQYSSDVLGVVAIANSLYLAPNYVILL